jgi:hypothetical protein
MSDDVPPPPDPSRRSRPRPLRPAELRERTARVFDTRTERWQEAGLSAEIKQAEARKAIAEGVVLLILLAAVLVAFAYRGDLFPGAGKPVRYVTAVLLVIIGWGLARAVGKGIAPALIKRMDPATAGSVGFFVRLLTIFVVILASLSIAGVKPETLAVGGAFTAVVLGLAAQQTLGNVIAGATLLSARPFRVADRVRIQGVGIDVEGTVATLGLFYTTLISGADRILIPNSVLMSTAVMPLNEPDPVRVRARFDSSRVTPAMIQAELEEQISVPLMRAPEILLDEIDADGDSSFEITATPEFSGDGAQLAADVLSAIARRGGEGDTDPQGEQAVGP